MSSPTASDLAAEAAADQRPSGEPVMVLEGVSVRYRVPRERIHSFKDYAIRWVKRNIAVSYTHLTLPTIYSV